MTAILMDPTFHRQHSWADSQSGSILPGLTVPLTQPVLNSQTQNQHQSIPSRTNRYEGYNLKVIQEPQVGRVAQGKEKDKKPLDPPTIVELGVRDDMDPQKMFLQSPYLICCAFLEPVGGRGTPQELKTVGQQLSGTTVSSLHRLKDTHNKDGAFFTFGDLVVKREGEYRLRITLMCMEDTYDASSPDGALGGWVTICETTTQEFKVHSNRNFPGMMESTFLTRSFSDQGVRLRLRKDSRTSQKNKRNEAVATRCDSLQNRGSSLYPHEEEAYETQNPAKRQRTTSGYSVGPPDYTSYSTAGAFASVPAQVLSSQTHQYSPPTTNPHPPALNPRASMGMIPSRHPSFQHHHHQAFPSPTGRHSPSSYPPYTTTPPYSNMYHQSPTSNGINLPPMDTQQQPLASSIPHSAGTSPRILATHTPVSTMGSPIEASYTTAAGPGHGVSYSMGPSYQQLSAFDQGTVRTDGVPTPLTAEMPAEALSGDYMAHAYYMPDSSSAATHRGHPARATSPGV